VCVTQSKLKEGSFRDSLIYIYPDDYNVSSV